jgi:hypothetical protein
MTKEEAIRFADTKWWETVSNKEIVAFQLFENKLCLPFDRYPAAIEDVLGRPVYTHEFGLNVEGLRAEFRKERGPATLEEIIALIPAEKRVLIVAPDAEDEEER